MSRKSLDLTLDFVKSLDRAHSREDVLDAIMPRLRSFGIETVIASLIPQTRLSARTQKDFIILENTPAEWGKQYFSQGYMYDDPIVRETMSATSGFMWSEMELTEPLHKRALRIMGEAQEIGMGDGFTVPITTLEEEKGGMTFSGRRLDLSPGQRGMLTLLTSYTVQKMLLINGQESRRPKDLTPRERETLQWTAEGKTDQEIGDLMGISMHGVDYHLRQARTKLGCVNRAQAVAEGFRRGLLN